LVDLIVSTGSYGSPRPTWYQGKEPAWSVVV